MATSTVNFDTVLAPISEDNPSGSDLKRLGLHDQLEILRKTDERSSMVGDVRESELRTADYGKVVTLATDALQSKGKDLQVAVWLAEALVKRQGFAGLRDGLRLVRELNERFWPTYYPVVEDGDVGMRAGRLEQLDRLLAHAARHVPVTQGKGGKRYTWEDWQMSRAFDKAARQTPEEIEQLQKQGRINGDEFDEAAKTTPRANDEKNYHELRAAREECQQLYKVVKEKFDEEQSASGGTEDPPTFSDLNKAISDCMILVEDILKQKPGPPIETDGTLREGAGEAAVEASGPMTASPRDRADALRRLASVADFFRRTEPHSPVSYLVQRAARWGEMPLDEWLKEVVSDAAVLGHIRETLGLKEPSS